MGSIDDIVVDAASGDFRLAPGSPALDAGVALGLAADHDGNPLVGPPDIGPFEAP